MPLRKSSEEKLLDAVDRLVFTRGIESTPVDAVLAEAGVSTATLYRGYRSKEELVAAALTRRHERWLQEWQEAIEAADDEEGRLLAIFDALQAFRRRPDGARWCAFLGAAAEYADPPPEIVAAIAQDTDAMRNGLRDLARALPGVGTRADADALAESLLLVVSGELAMRLRGPGAQSGRSVAQVLVRAAAGGVGVS